MRLPLSSCREKDLLNVFFFLHPSPPIFSFFFFSLFYLYFFLPRLYLTRRVKSASPPPYYTVSFFGIAVNTAFGLLYFVVEAGAEGSRVSAHAVVVFESFHGKKKKKNPRRLSKRIYLSPLAT